MPYAHVNDLDISYELIGEGRPWVITPGGRFSKDDGGIRELAETLAAAGNQALIWDRPNCGASQVCFTGESESTMQAGAKGIKISVSGRLGGAEIARQEKAGMGSVPLTTLQADVNYGYAIAYTTYGTIGVKTWIYRGYYDDPAQVQETDIRPGGGPRRGRR